MTDPIRDLIAAFEGIVSAYAESPYVIAGLEPHLPKGRIAINALAAAEARPEPAAEPRGTRCDDAVRNARHTAEHIAMYPKSPSDGLLVNITLTLCDAVEALAREVRRG